MNLSFKANFSDTLVGPVGCLRSNRATNNCLSHMFYIFFTGELHHFVRKNI